MVRMNVVKEHIPSTPVAPYIVGWENGPARVRNDHPPSLAEAEKIKSLIRKTDVCLTRLDYKNALPKV